MGSILPLITGLPSQAPTVTPLVYSFLVTLLLAAIGLTRIYYTSPSYRLFWRRVQLVQVISLYTWYLLAHFDLMECLPCYHCRIATLAILFLPKGKIKTYFAYLGVVGAVCAFLHPIFDPYPFPHVTILSYVIGHVALIINCLSYLYQQRSDGQLSFKTNLQMTLSLNILIGVVDILLQANYGFLRETPLLAGKNGLINLLLVTLVISALTHVIQGILVKEIDRLPVRV